MYAKIALISGLVGLFAGGAAVHYYAPKLQQATPPAANLPRVLSLDEFNNAATSPVRLLGTFTQGSEVFASLDNGQTLRADFINRLPGETRVRIAGTWYSTTPKPKEQP